MDAKQELKLYDDAYEEVVKSTNTPVLSGLKCTLKTDNYTIEAIGATDPHSVLQYRAAIKHNGSAETCRFIGLMAKRMHMELYNKFWHNKRQR